MYNFFFFNSFRICIEVLDGLRICFNYFLFKKLLINENEQSQYYNAIGMILSPPEDNVSPQYDWIIFIFVS